MEISHNHKLVMSVFLLLVLLIISFFNVRDSSEKNREKQINSSVFSLFSKAHFNSSNTLKSKKIILFVDFTDFSCLQCEEGVIYICKTLANNIVSNSEENLLILIRKSKKNEDYYEWLIDNWKYENSIVFPILLDRNNIFETAYIFKTSLAILNENNSLIEYKEFPLRKKELDEIIKIITDSFAKQVNK